MYFHLFIPSYLNQMTLKKKLILWKDSSRQKEIKLDFRCDCTSVNVIYVYVCLLCPNNDSFYFGQTITPCRKRLSEHRAKFTISEFAKSALSYHVHQDHPNHIHRKLNNFSLGVIKATSPGNLDRLEDYYVELTEAELSLNRYKVTAK